MYGKMYDLPQGLTSLQQGKKLNDFQKDHLHIVGPKRLNLIEQTTSPNLGSIEPMTNNSSNPIDIENEKIKASLSSLQDQFNSTLANYTSAYKKNLDRFVDAESANSYIFYGPAVGMGNGRIQVQKIITEGSTIIFLIQDGKYTKIVKSDPNLTNQHGYHYVGKIGQYGTIPLVDSGEGYYNVYYNILKDYVFYGPYIGNGKVEIPVQKILTEKSKIVLLIQDKQYTKIIKTTPSLASQEGFYYVGQLDQYGKIPLINMEKGKYNVKNESIGKNNNLMNNTISTNVAALNEQLLNIANQMYQEAGKIEKTSDGVELEGDVVKSALLSQIQTLNQEREKILNMNTNLNTLEAELSEAETEVSMEKIRNIGLGISALILGGIVFNVLTRK